MKKVLFIGAGRMASAISSGMVKCGFAVEDIKAYDILEQAAEKFTENTGIKCFCDNINELIDEADVVFIAVKPQYLAGAVGSFDGKLADKFIVSIVAGASIAKLAELTGSSHIVRVMPNTPALVGKGCAAFSGSEEATEEELLFVENVLKSVGVAFKLPEKLMDAVTALSGSGPAYIFEMVDAMSDGGGCCGLPRELALEMAIATCEGAAAMLRETKLHPAILKDQVTSPGGTTMRALERMKDGNFREIMVKAVKGACDRSEELGRNV